AQPLASNDEIDLLDFEVESGAFAVTLASMRFTADTNLARSMGSRAIELSVYGVEEDSSLTLLARGYGTDEIRVAGDIVFPPASIQSLKLRGRITQQSETASLPFRVPALGAAIILVGLMTRRTRGTLLLICMLVFGGLTCGRSGFEQSQETRFILSDSDSLELNTAPGIALQVEELPLESAPFLVTP
ncbi:MAG: hypothetical protein AAF658_04140, partial [Myxococcota bacterium]